MSVTQCTSGNAASVKKDDCPTTEQVCVVCGKKPFDNAQMICNEEGKCICRRCALSIRAFLQEEDRRAAIFGRSLRRLAGPQSPSVMKAKLDQYVVGQEQAKRMLAVAAYNHWVNRIVADTSADAEGNPFKTAKGSEPVKVQRSNALLLGPTGCGKTELIRALADVLDAPVEIVDATSLTPVGYVGDSASDILARVIREAAGNAANAEFSIIFIDEIDKLAVSRKSREVMTREVNGINVQRSLLKFIEGCEIDVPKIQTSGTTPAVNIIDTSHILFVGGGVFEGLLDITDRRVNGSAAGFGTSTSGSRRSVTYADVTTDDLIAYGFLPEFIGRFPILTPLEKLDHKALIEVMTQPKNNLCAQYREIFDRSGIKLVFTQDALDEIADRALKAGTGARGLRSIMESVLNDYMYEYLGDGYIEKIIINGGCVRGTNTAVVSSRPEPDDDLPIQPSMTERLKKRVPISHPKSGHGGVSG